MLTNYQNAFLPESSIIRGLILDSRDLFSNEKFEDRLDVELAIFIRNFHKTKTVDVKQVTKVVNKFITVVDKILRELEDQKRKAVRIETNRIADIRKFLIEGTRINSKKLKKHLEGLSKNLNSNTVSALRGYRRREKRLRRGQGPIGYVLKKVRKDAYLDAEVARKAYELGENTQQEHKLIINVEYLIQRLDQNPEGIELEGLKSEITKLVRAYEDDLEIFLNIEIDRDIVQARKLHRIDHYITFLKTIRKYGDFKDLIEKLNGVKIQANNWVYQDSINAEKLRKYAIRSMTYGMDLLKTSKAFRGKHFPGIETVNQPIEDTTFGGVKVHGILIRKVADPISQDLEVRYKKPNRAVVLIHGVLRDKETLLTLGKKLAMQNYWVYSIDLTTHGESREKIHLGRSSEFILTTVRWFRLNGIKNVGVIGHSLGCVVTLYALSGYTKDVEEMFFGQVNKFKDKMEQIDRILSRFQNEKDDLLLRALTSKTKESIHYNYELRKLFEELRDIYVDLKKIVFDGLKDMYKTYGKIDAAVLLSAPKTIQSVFPAKVANFLKKRNRLTSTIILNKTLNILMNLGYRLKGGPFAKVEKSIARWGEIQAGKAVTTDIYYTFNYAATVKNPFDFIEAINYMCGTVKYPDKEAETYLKDHPDRETLFFQYYRKLIRRVPKLYIYGIADFLIKPLKNNNMPELEAHYISFGSTDRVRIPNVAHSLNKEGFDWQYESSKLPKVTFKIVTFLNKYLPTGRMI